MFSNIILYLIGFAGTGKYTIAQEIAKKADFKVVDNHLINNPILSVIQIDGKTPIDRNIWAEIKKIRSIVLDTIVNYSPAHFNFIFTNELVKDNPEDLYYYNTIKQVADARKSIFIPVRLICSGEELMRRVSSNERIKMFKSINAERALYQANTQEVFQPEHENTIVLDVSNLEPEQAAKVLLDKISQIVSKN